MYDRNSNATELTPLTGGLYRNKYTASLLTTNYNNDRYYMRLIKHIWSQISKYVWKLVLFLLILVIINTIFRSLFKQETSLIFTSDHGNNNNNNNLNSNYALSNDEIEPNLIWIVTDLELTQDSPYLNTLINQGLLLQNYHISYSPATYSMNRISSLTSKYVDKLTDDDINDNYFDKFISQKYEIHKSNDIDIDMDGFNSFPFLIYMMLDGQVSINHFENKIEGIISDLKLKENNQIWQNSLLIINSDTTPFSLLYGPRIPNKKRGTKSQILFQAVDWEPTLLHFSHNTQSDDEALDNDGFDLWETLFYNEISARKDIPTQKDIQITEDKIYKSTFYCLADVLFPKDNHTMSSVVQITGNDLLSLNYNYKRDIHWEINDIASDEISKINNSDEGILYNIPPLNDWFKSICNPQSRYYSNSTLLLNDIYDSILSINDSLSTNILQLIIQFCCCPFYNYISLNSLINEVCVNDDNRTRNEYAFNVLNDGEEAWNKWYNGSFDRYRKGIPNKNVLVIAFYFDFKVFIHRYMIQTANDFEFRDPVKWVLFAENRENIQKHKDKVIRNVIDHQNGKHKLSSSRWSKRWFDIDAEKVYSDENKCCDGYDIYVLAIYGNAHNVVSHSNEREMQIGQIQLQCVDKSKMFLCQEFDGKVNKLIQIFNKKGMSKQELEQYFRVINV